MFTYRWWFQPTQLKHISISQIGSLPQLGVKIKKHELPPPSYFLIVCESSLASIVMITICVPEFGRHFGSPKRENQNSQAP